MHICKVIFIINILIIHINYIDFNCSYPHIIKSMIDGIDKSIYLDYMLKSTAHFITDCRTKMQITLTSTKKNKK